MRQGEVYWLTFAGRGSEPDGRRPAVVVQHDRFNRSAIQTTIVAAITSNLRLAGMPGNVRLRKGESNLPRPCLVNVTQLRTVDRERLIEKVGHLSPARLREVLAGLGLVLGLDALGQIGDVEGTAQ
jgi:mRNA interferase MazF